MPSTFSLILPFLIFCIVVAGIVFVVGSISLLLDLRKMRRERKEGLPSVWYQRPKVRSSFEGIGVSLGLLFIVGAFGYSLVYHFPLWIVVMSEASIGLVGAGIFLILDLRNIQRERREGLPSVWHRQPKPLRRLGQIGFCLGFLLMMGVGAYDQAQGFPDSYYPWNMVIGFFVPLLLLFSSGALYYYANTLQKRRSRSY